METSQSLLTSGVTPPVCVMFWRRVGQDQSQTMDSPHSVFISSCVPFPPLMERSLRARPYRKLPTWCNPKVINVLTDEPSGGGVLKTQRSQTAEVRVFVCRSDKTPLQEGALCIELSRSVEAMLGNPRHGKQNKWGGQPSPSCLQTLRYNLIVTRLPFTTCYM